MSEPDLKKIADERFARVLAETGARDPRDFYRDRLRALRERDERGFQQALEYYETRLVPAVTAEDSDVLGEWLDYGRVLAQLFADGQPVQIDPSGRAVPYRRPVPLDHLVLHLPTSAREPAQPIGLPAKLSAAQRATYELLVKQALSGGE